MPKLPFGAQTNILLFLNRKSKKEKNMFMHPIETQSCQNTPPLIIAHVLHPQHPVTLENGGPYCCDGCQKQSPGGGSRYSCRACNFDLDWACAMSNLSSWSTVPSVIPPHFLHPQHSLTLQTGYGYRCNACGNTSPGGTRYRCLDCDFDLDWACALSSHSHRHFHSSPAVTPPLPSNYGQALGPPPYTPAGYYNIPGQASFHSYPQYQNNGGSGTTTTTACSKSGYGKALAKGFFLGLAKGAVVDLLLG